MRYFYGQYRGEEFPTPDRLFRVEQLLDFIVRHGEQALKAMEQLMREGADPQQLEALDQIMKEGLLYRDGAGRLRLTPRAIGRMERKALMEVFSHLRAGQREGHEKITPGRGGERIEGTKPYEFGDPVSEIDVHQSLHNALRRQGLPRPGTRPIIRLSERDLEMHLHEGLTSCSTVILLDQSGSMMRYGRFAAAKRVAMAMQALVRGRFPQDTLDIVGFFSGAARIPEWLLPLAMPKPVTIFDYNVRLRVPLEKLLSAPQHFTNLHMGLQLARRILRRRTSENKQVFIITDGQPTAHVEGEYVYLLYPPDQRSTVETLKEAVLAVREGIRICTFALIEDYWGMEWVGFVEQLTRLTKGVAFYTSAGELASCIMESYMSGRKKKTYIA